MDCLRKWLRVLMLPFITGLMLSAGVSNAAAQEETPAADETPTAEATQTPAEARVVITAPQPGAILSGTIAISGVASSGDFRAYVVEIAPDPFPAEADWPDIQPPVTQQVLNQGVLAQWDTTNVNDGRYIIRLRVLGGTEEDPTSASFEVHIEVRNEAPTAIPQLPTVTLTAIPGTATAGPSPTALIQQPPTRTPRPTITPGGPTRTPEPLLPEDSPIDPERLQDAAVQGVRYTFIAFGLLALYSIIRAAYRGTLADGWRQFRAEIITPLWDGLRGRGS